MDDKRLGLLPLFATLSRHELKELSRWADEVDCPEGKQLVTEGEFAYEFFVIEDGTAEVRVGDRTLAALGIGDFFGEMGLRDHVRRRASVVATSPLTAVVMTGGAFRQMSRELPGVEATITAAVEERCRELERLVG
jgi:CRP/FNR family transcriptional regulator, cyclic AMP receptor protein